MSGTPTSNTLASIDFLKHVALSFQETALEGLGDDDAPPLPTYETDSQQAVTVGSQLSEFSKAVPGALRPQIDKGFLMAQLAANAQIEEHGGDAVAWYDKYVEVLYHIGWVADSKSDLLRNVAGASLEVHKQIIPLLTSALGPVAAAASVVLHALDGLAAMDSNQSWITLFDRESQRASANQFQVSYVDVDDETRPALTLATFVLDASRSVTRVLFFRFSNTSAKLLHSETKMSLNQMVFNKSSPIVSDRLSSRTVGYLTDLRL